MAKMDMLNPLAMANKLPGMNKITGGVNSLVNKIPGVGGMINRVPGLNRVLPGRGQQQGGMQGATQQPDTGIGPSQNFQNPLANMFSNKNPWANAAGSAISGIGGFGGAKGIRDPNANMGFMQEGQPMNNQQQGQQNMGGQQMTGVEPTEQLRRLMMGMRF